ncbi:MAG: hypothetical protein ACR2PL_28655 [Dehalococcoidia bacterium]
MNYGLDLTPLQPLAMQIFHDYSFIVVHQDRPACQAYSRDKFVFADHLLSAADSIVSLAVPLPFIDLLVRRGIFPNTPTQNQAAAWIANSYFRNGDVSSICSSG